MKSEVFMIIFNKYLSPNNQNTYIPSIPTFILKLILNVNKAKRYSQLFPRVCENKSRLFSFLLNLTAFPKIYSIGTGIFLKLNFSPSYNNTHMFYFIFIDADFIFIDAENNILSLEIKNFILHMEKGNRCREN